MSLDARQIELSDEQKRELAELAERAGRPWPEVFADALKAYRPPCEEQPSGEAGLSLAEGLARDGLLGCVKDVPPDLSTNPEHMKGFGRDQRTCAD